MSYTNLIYHIVFSTKERRDALAAERIARICKYTAGIIRNHEGVPLAVNGVGDHLHIAAIVSPKIALSQFVGTVFRALPGPATIASGLRPSSQTLRCG